MCRADIVSHNLYIPIGLEQGEKERVLSVYKLLRDELYPFQECGPVIAPDQVSPFLQTGRRVGIRERSPFQFSNVPVL